MLDDLKYIHERDAQDALGNVAKQWQQLKYEFEVDWQPKEGIHSIAVGGMGGSALAATILYTWPQTTVPLEVIRNYDLPPSINEATLFIASSYSGNTEETLEALTQAESRHCQILVIAAGGKLAQKATERSYPLFSIPSGLQPRMAVFYNLSALLHILDKTGLSSVTNGVAELRAGADWLKGQIDSWLVEPPTANNRAKQIAQELMGKSVVMYGGPLMYPAAYKWKINFNENSKHIAWVGQYPEFNHNEFLGWTKQPVDKPYGVIDLRSNLENARVQKRFVVSERLLSGMRPAPIVINAEGDNILQQLLWVITLGDFVSVYLSLLSNLNPTPVDLIEKFKAEMAK
jgi:glucose/mannose-6-phosphate isomerase